MFHKCIFFIFLIYVFSSTLSYSNMRNLPLEAFTKIEVGKPLSITKPQEFVLFTMPKTGSHLVIQILEKLMEKEAKPIWALGSKCPKAYEYDLNRMNLLLSLPNTLQTHWLYAPVSSHTFISLLNDLSTHRQYLMSHTPFSSLTESLLKERNCIIFFIIRDPRDYIISLIRHPRTPGADIFIEPEFNLLSLDEQIKCVIKGTTWYNSTSTVLSKFLPWEKSPLCCPLRFEKLMGPNSGGGTKQEQIAELKKIAKILKLKITNQRLLNVFNESYGHSATFNQGKVGGWKDYFNEENKTLFKKLLGKKLIELGYEKDNNW